MSASPNPPSPLSPTPEVYTPRLCRACAGTLDPVLALGAIQLSGYLSPEEVARPTAPLTLCSCRVCQLVQLQHTTTRDLLFEQYWYRSGVNEVMRAELHDVVESAVAMVGLAAKDVVLDIGANDGTLLSQYAAYDWGLLRVAFEPAQNLQAQLARHCERLVPTYFPGRADQIRTLAGRVKIITSIAMVYAVDHLAPFFTAIQQLLHEDGVWIVQFQDLAGMIRTTAFDNICHEHLCYFSLQSFEALAATYGLRVVDVVPRAINGGSYRLSLRHVLHAANPSVRAMRAREAGCQDWAALERFAWQVEETKRQIRATLRARVRAGQTIDLYGASTKANTLLQVCGLDRQWLRQAWERSPEKVGLRTAGTDIPIVDEETGRADPPDALLVGIYQYRDLVLGREAAYLEHGGTVIFPLPAVDIVTVDRRIHAHG